MRKIAIEGQRLRDAKSLHHQETQTVDSAVTLVLVSLQNLERPALLVKAGAMNAGASLVIEAIANQDSLLMSSSAAGQRDGFHHHEVGRDEEIRKMPAPKLLQSFKSPRVIFVVGLEERVKETRIDEDHALP